MRIKRVFIVLFSLLVLLFSSFSLLAKDNNSDGFDDDDVAMLKKISTDNPNNSLEWTGTDYGNWKGVTWSQASNKRINYLEIDDCNLTKLDFSGDDIKLNYLNFSENQLTSLNLSNLLQLTSLSCNKNQLTSLDLSNNSQLRSLSCGNNQLTSLDLSNNPQLGSLHCYENQISDLVLSNNPKLYGLGCYDNQIANLDLSKCSKLRSLSCSRNQLTSLDLTNNPEFYYLDCFSNQLTNLDLSNNLQLKRLYCTSNQLTDLDLSNNLQLTDLDCRNNQLVNLNITNQTQLKELLCSSNQLTSLDVSKNVNMENLRCDNNQIPSLDLSSHGELYGISCSDNQLVKLKLPSYGEKVKTINCSGNQLVDLDLSNCQNLWLVHCSDNQIDRLDFSKLAKLEQFSCSNNQLSSLDVSSNLKLTHFSCNNNQLTSLDITNNPKLRSVFCHNNKLSEIDMTNNIDLKSFDCSGNQFSSIDVSNNLSLSYFHISGNILPFSEIIKGMHVSDFEYNPQEKVFDEKTFSFGYAIDYPSEKAISGIESVFEWYKDDLIIEGEVSEKYTPTALGVYYCKITNTGFPDLVLTTNNVTVINNDYPSRIISTTFNIDENSPNESLVGLVLTEDEDVELFHPIFSITDDSDIFTINSKTGELIVNNNENLDFERNEFANIIVSIDDLKHDVVSKNIRININDLTEAPAKLQLSNKAIDENLSIGTEVGTLSSLGEFSNTVINYTMAENEFFELIGSQLKSKLSFNYEERIFYRLQFTATDDRGLFTSQDLFIEVTNVNETPVFISTPNTDIERGKYYNYSAEAMDVDGDACTFSAIQKPDWLTFYEFHKNFFVLQGEAPRSNGNYTIILEFSDGEFSVRQEYVLSVSGIAVGIEEVQSQKAVNIYPNPVVDKLHVDLYDLDSDEVTISLLSLNGRVIDKEVVDSSSGFVRLRKSVRNLCDGIYILLIEEKRNRKAFKIIKK